MSVPNCFNSLFQSFYLSGDPQTLYNSVHGKILSLPEDTLLYPAHDYNGKESYLLCIYWITCPHAIAAFHLSPVYISFPLLQKILQKVQRLKDPCFCKKLRDFIQRIQDRSCFYYNHYLVLGIIRHTSYAMSGGIDIFICKVKIYQVNRFNKQQD